MIDMVSNTYLQPKPTRVAKAHLDLRVCKNIRIVS